MKWQSSFSEEKKMWSVKVFTQSAKLTQRTQCESLVRLHKSKFSSMGHLYLSNLFTVNLLTGRHGPTVQTQIKLLLRSSLIRVYTVCNSISVI